MQRLLAVALMLFLVSAADAQTLTKRPVSQGEVTLAEMTERLEKAAVRTKAQPPADTELGVANIAPQRARKREYFPQCWPASPTQQITRLCSATASVLSELI